WHSDTQKQRRQGNFRTMVPALHFFLLPDKTLANYIRKPTHMLHHGVTHPFSSDGDPFHENRHPRRG
ncbi:MAG: hypothetical protein AAFP16_20120, partial [Pseudomonadota bacterium]